MKDIRKKLVAEIQKTVQQSIDSANEAIKAAVEAKLSETKSSAGDKFETGRAMMQREQEQNEMQLAKAQHSMLILKSLKIDTIHERCTLGALVVTDTNHYFLSIGHGKVTIGDEKVFAISPGSPIGTLLLGKGRGDSIEFRGQVIRIGEIY